MAMNETTRRMNNLTMAVVMLTTTTGCAIKHDPWYGYAPTVSAAAIPTWNWAGTPFEVKDDRQLPPKVLITDTPQSWEKHWTQLSNQVVEETRRIMLEAVGPAKSNAPRNLMISIIDYKAAPESGSWIGTSTIKAQSRRLDVVDQEWTGQARVERFNWLGADTGRAVLNEAYQAAIADLLRQLANTKAHTTDKP